MKHREIFHSQLRGCDWILRDTTIEILVDPNKRFQNTKESHGLPPLTLEASQHPSTVRNELRRSCSVDDRHLYLLAVR